MNGAWTMRKTPDTVNDPLPIATGRFFSLSFTFVKERKQGEDKIIGHLKG